MKRLLVTFSTAILLTSTATAYAGGYGGHYRGHYGGHYGYHGSSKSTDYLVGGLILGGLLGYAFSQSSHRHHHDHHYQAVDHYGYRRSYPVSNSYTVRREVVSEPYYSTYSSRPVMRQQSHLHRDRHGNCFRISYGRNGEELRAEQPRSVCNW
jgi:fatty acid desaturase